MTTTSATTKSGGWSWPAHGAARLLGLAASPTFALMGWAAASDGPMALCSSGAGALPMHGMTAMYLLMSLFHLSPWLKLASARL